MRVYGCMIWIFWDLCLFCFFLVCFLLLLLVFDDLGLSQGKSKGAGAKAFSLSQVLCAMSNNIFWFHFSSSICGDFFLIVLQLLSIWYLIFWDFFFISLCFSLYIFIFHYRSRFYLFFFSDQFLGIIFHLFSLVAVVDVNCM